ncbi:polysaccharide pyruvyl transferase family protein [Rhizobium lusitanum]|uniref:Polysaccharide pyruvyl transferase WcaK-like protein n=1 Tax=Rhizobium lusitanum TaxID=293958 RepID=A0A7X0IUH1_9HYPH|nr:polysaccharide pyruvyl transferase family protein [Rhizobium lusitanum]MBB6486257.1 polysaccharide pyruvyl transferase WcaK-like protein [Rhizobium lusitanum]
MKILVFNVKYSENLGDGMLAECIETALANGGGEVEVETVDLAGRQAFARGHGARRRLILGLLRWMPAAARRRLVSLGLKRNLRRLVASWDEKIANADVVVIGGGNLFQDDDLNFPLKIGTVLDCVCQQDRPLAIYAVGVSKHWSSSAYELFSRVKRARLVHLSVRDGFAQDNWHEHFPEGPRAKIVRDPGLLIGSLTMAQRPCQSTERRLTVGLCVTDPIILRRHSTSALAAIPFSNIGVYRDLIGLLLDDGLRVVLFCNGAREDQRFAECIRSSVVKHRATDSDAFDIAERPKTPGDLIETIRSVDVILAHRLHACIAAYALKIPHVGLGWDKKVEGFFNSVGREDYLVKDATSSPLFVASLVRAAERDGIEPLRHQIAIAETRAGISNMRRHLLECDQSSAPEPCPMHGE